MPRKKTRKQEKLEVGIVKQKTGTFGYRIYADQEGFSIGGIEGIGQYRNPGAAASAGKARVRKIESRS